MTIFGRDPWRNNCGELTIWGNTELLSWHLGGCRLVVTGNVGVVDDEARRTRRRSLYWHCRRGPDPHHGPERRFMSEPDGRYGQQVFAPDHHLRVLESSLNPLGLAVTYYISPRITL